MRNVPSALVAALASGLFATPLLAAPAGQAPEQSATPLLHPVQDNRYGGYTYGFGWGYGWDYDYKPACPSNYHYTCWHDPYGYRHCGCVLNRW